MKKFMHLDWQRHPDNPILPPGPAGSYDSKCCMNPCVVKVGDIYRLYYAGADENQNRRICLAESTVDRPLEFERKGVILDVGAEGAFDCNWCVLPTVHRFGDKWHLYYTGNNGDWSLGLQSFAGIGLALSDDGINFEKYSDAPIILGNQTQRFPDNRGIAGGKIVEDVLADGSIRYRYYHTLTVGHPDPDLKINQEKHAAVCHSMDGINWTDHRVVLSPRPEVPKEDAAATGGPVWRDGNLYRMLYCGIGSKWGAYSISEAVSDDGYDWYRGDGEENLSLAPDPDSSWESEMVEYPFVIKEGNQLRLFYCGNDYGATGIGTAVASVRAQRE
ncbi:MAG: hypothetical protein HRU15_09385 [Planctomycetes bacterium]|nr:hypothetical protein [Planctomycetota bacterium]